MQFAKTIIRNPINMGILLEFAAVFPDEKPLPFEEYLKGGNRDFILNVAASLLGSKSHNSKFNDNRELMKMFFGNANQEFAKNIYSKILTLEKTHNKVGMINPYVSLTLFEYFFKRSDEEQTQTDAEFEVNFFKAYLVLNSKYTTKQHIAFASTKNLEKALTVPMMLFCMNYPVYDKQHYDTNEIWITQLWKAMQLFLFLEKSEKTRPLYNAFLKYFDVADWQEYLKSLLPLTTSVILHGKEGHTDFTVSQGGNYEKACTFLDRLIVEEDEEIIEFDFLTIRSKPFYKVKDGVYRIIFNLFVIEKIFKGMYFLFREVNKTLPEKQQIKELKSLIGNDFSEQVILYNILDAIYPTKCIKFSGQQIVDNGIKGGPDYYVRKHNSILIFESKDFLIPAKVKMSFDFSKYQDAFEKKLYFEEVDGKEKHVGVMQLVAFIKKLLKNQFTADSDYKYRGIEIYPIIVVHDHQYNTPGFNSLINYWFQAELEDIKEKGFYVDRVNPLVIINIDSLIYHQVGLTESIPLHRVLDEYFKHTKVQNHIKFHSENEMKDYVLSKQVAFSMFINEYFHDHGLRKMPPIMQQVVPKLFNVDEMENPYTIK